jgi:CRISPR/Cas system-associated exonuclease Cas4 (RecB family)
MTRLSYSTIANCLQLSNSHCWINRVAEIQIPETDAMRNGKRLHRILQDYLNHKQGITLKEFVDYRFPIVEQEEKDPKTHFEIFIDNDFLVHGYLDGKNPDKKQILEIKTSNGKFWSLSDFLKCPQLWIYALGNPEYDMAVCVTALSDETLWTKQPCKVYELPLTDKMREKGKKYIQDAIDLFRKGDFTGGLTNGHCEGWCNYGRECLFKS